MSPPDINSPEFRTHSREPALYYPSCHTENKYIVYIYLLYILVNTIFV